MKRRTPHEPRSCRPSLARTADGRIRVRWPNGSSQTLGLMVAAEFHERLGDLIWDTPIDRIGGKEVPES